MVHIIGAGLGRTGTDSLRAALDRLGFGPCHHMRELFAQPETIVGWARAARGEHVDWGEILAGYASTVDWPSVAFWRELVDAYPNARVILTLRDPYAWYESATNTIHRARFAVHPELEEHLRVVERLVWQGTFGGRFTDREHAIAVYEAHYDAVRAYVPEKRLLEFDVRDGWAPLCEFLAVAVPPEDFPKLNTTAAFHSRVAG